MSTLVVNKSGNTGAGSLRTIAGAAQNGDSIVFDPSFFSVTLTADLHVANAITIDGGALRQGETDITMLGNWLLDLAGSDSLANMTIGGSVRVQNDGSVSQYDLMTVGDRSNGSAQIINGAGHTWLMEDGASILRGNTKATFTNLGKLESSSSTAIGLTLISPTTGSASIAIDSGTLAFTGGGSFDREAVSGNGSLVLSGGSSTIGYGTRITTGFDIGSNATVKLDGSLNVAKDFNMRDGSLLDLGSYKLTLTGFVQFLASQYGAPTVTAGTSGRLQYSGSGAYIDTLAVGGKAIVMADSYTHELGRVTLGDSTNGAAQIRVGANQTWGLDINAGIVAGSTAAFIYLTGGSRIEKIGGQTSVVAPKIVNSATSTAYVGADVGTLELGGPLSGLLGLYAASGSTLQVDGTASSQTAFSFDPAGGSTFVLKQADRYHGSVAGMTAGRNLDLLSIAYDAADTSYAYNANTLSVTDGTHHANIAMVGSYDAGSFHLAGDAHGGTMVTYG